MSILKREYEISVWEDYFDSHGKPNERRVAVIGSDKMTTHARATNPNFVRNINGNNTLSFKMLYQYTDPVTGEDKHNLFVDLISNETKVKLKRKDKWYDFIVTGINENTSDKSYTYSLEDAFIHELSKNGFSTTLNAELMNNLGTAPELVEKILEGTDWSIDRDNSDTIIQTANEQLVLVNLDDVGCTKLKAPTDESGVSATEKQITLKGQALAFYSCCKDTPRRFQFIYYDNLTWNSTTGKLTYGSSNLEVAVDEDNFIKEDVSGNQYYIENGTYGDADDTYKFSLPSGVTLAQKPIIPTYRGRRYVFGQKTAQMPNLNKIVELGIVDGVEYAHFTESQDNSPQLVQNLVCNSEFASSAGWVAQKIAEGATRPTVEAKTRVYFDNGKTSDDIFSEDDFTRFGESALGSISKITPYLHINSTGANQVVVESGFRVNRNSLTESQYGPGAKFVLAWKMLNGTLDDCVKKIELANYQYNSDKDCYVINNTNCYATITNFGDTTKKNEIEKVVENGTTTTTTTTTETYNYLIFNLNGNAPTLSIFKEEGARLFLYLTSGKSAKIEDFQAFPYVESSTAGVPVFPMEQSAEVTFNTIHKYFEWEEYKEADKWEDVNVISHINNPWSNWVPEYYEDASKVSQLTVQESNYFNNLQSLAEKFECWIDFNITRADDTGLIAEGGKKIRIRKEIGQDNFAPVRYGINLKGITRSNDSKSLVTKLIVKQNSNSLGENGFCTIARAGANPTGDTTLYDFSYYLRRGMLDENQLNEDLYGNGGYYTELARINSNLNLYTEELLEISEPLIQAEAELSVAKLTLQTVAEKVPAITECFYKLENQDITNITNAKDLSDGGKDYLQQWLEYMANKQDADETVARLQPVVDAYNGRVERLTELVNTATNQKKALNLEFYKKYCRFIKEGTWISEEYYDDNKYYLDALSTLYNSCWPKATYTINIAYIAGMRNTSLEWDNYDNYDLYEYQIGDRTHVIDTEYFGYEADGITPIKRGIVITSISEFLDAPQNDTFTVQTEKDQFQDLFKKITATTQQVQFKQGGYDKAEELADADTAQKLAYLSNAMKSAEMVIQNSGTQDVKIDKDGITVIDMAEKSNFLRLVGGAIMFHRLDENGQDEWKTGITPDGIVADLITTGQLNTGLIQIMNGESPTFRWDSYGLTAYKYDTNENGAVTSVDTGSGVRFDQYGVYGFQGAGSNWRATGLDEIEDGTYTNFSLTKNGLKINLGKNTYYNGAVTNHESKANFGKVDDKLYTENYKPLSREENSYYYEDDNGNKVQYDEEGEKIAKVINVNDRFIVYDDGYLVASGANLTGYATDQSLNDKAAELSGKIDTAEEALAAQIEKQGQDLQNQIDGAISTYFQDYIPTNANEPAATWIEQGKEAEHVGDLFYIVGMETGEGKVSSNGQVYRWVNSGTDSNPSYEWIIIADEALAQALSDAAKAQSTADGKSTTYFSLPTTGYCIGDTYILETERVDKNGNTYSKGTILTAVEEGGPSSTYTQDHWESKTRYTDDSALNTFINTDFSIAKEQLDKKIESYYQATDPAIYEGEAKWDDTHTGDMWYCTADIDNNHKKNTTWRWSGSAWEQQEVSEEVENLIKSKAQFFYTSAEGTPTIPYYVGDHWSRGEDYPIYVCVNERTTSSYVADDWKISSTADKLTGDGLGTVGSTYVSISNEGVLRGSNAIIDGDIYAKTGHIGGTGSWTLDENGKWSSDWSGGWTIDEKGLYYGDDPKTATTFLTATPLTENDTVVTGAPSGTKYVFKAGSNFGVTSTGTLYAQNGSFTGTIDAKGGWIGGWNITSSKIQNSNNTVGLFSGAANSTANPSRAWESVWNWSKDSEGNKVPELSPIRFYAGGSDSKENPETKAKFAVLEDGSLYAEAANIAGTILSDSGKLSVYNIDSTRLWSSLSGDEGRTHAYQILTGDSLVLEYYDNSKGLASPPSSGTYHYFKTTVENGGLKLKYVNKMEDATNYPIPNTYGECTLVIEDSLDRGIQLLGERKVFLTTKNGNEVYRWTFSGYTLQSPEMPAQIKNSSLPEDATYRIEITPYGITQYYTTSSFGRFNLVPWSTLLGRDLTIS